MIQKIIISIVMVFVTFLGTACQHVSKPLTYPDEASLVANSFNNGLSIEIDTDYAQAYAHLKQAYQHCIAYTREDQLIFTDNRLEEHLEMGTLFARTDNGHYLYKMLVEGLRDGRTRLTLFLPKQHAAAQQRFKQDILRAKGEDKQCNHTPLAQNKTS